MSGIRLDGTRAPTFNLWEPLGTTLRFRLQHYPGWYGDESNGSFRGVEWSLYAIQAKIGTVYMVHHLNSRELRGALDHKCYWFEFYIFIFDSNLFLIKIIPLSNTSLVHLNVLFI